MNRALRGPAANSSVPPPTIAITEPEASRALGTHHNNNVLTSATKRNTTWKSYILHSSRDESQSWASKTKTSTLCRQRRSHVVCAKWACADIQPRYRASNARVYMRLSRFFLSSIQLFPLFRFSRICYSIVGDERAFDISNYIKTWQATSKFSPLFLPLSKKLKLFYHKELINRINTKSFCVRFPGESGQLQTAR